MECKSCGYRLWNLPGRHCPECGMPFRPSEFEFARNSVAFCCPHCDQAYYGTGSQGHLEPPQFDCVKCGRHVDMDAMVLRPAAGVREESTRPYRNPWLSASRVGLMGWLKTVRDGSVRPTALIQATPSNAPVTRAMSFAGINTVLVPVFSTIPIVLLFAMPIMVGGGQGGFLGLGLAMMAFGTLFVYLVLMAIWALVAHAMLLLTGGAQFDFSRTLSAVCYSSGPILLGAVPCFGFYLAPVAWVWWIVTATIMVKEGQGTTGGKAAAAMLTFPLVALGILVGVIVATVVA